MNTRAHNKKSLLAIGVLMLSMAALQSPLWRNSGGGTPIAVRSGGVTLIQSKQPISQAVLESALPASVEVVGDHEVLIRGKALGETNLNIAAKDGHTSTYRVVVQADSAQSFLELH